MTGSGPSVKLAGAAALTSGDSQPSGKEPGGRPSNTKPDAVVRQRTGEPLAIERDRADSSKAARRTASRSSCVCAESRSAKLTPADATAMIATTSSSSNSVNPRTEAVRRSGGAWGQCLLPRANI